MNIDFCICGHSLVEHKHSAIVVETNPCLVPNCICRDYRYKETRNVKPDIHCPCGAKFYTDVQHKEHLLDCPHVKQVQKSVATVSDLAKALNDTDDKVDHPQHYNFSEYEVIDVITAWGLGFNLGNSIKYIARGKYKGDYLKNLNKAKWYLEEEIGRVEGKGKSKEIH